MRFFIGKAYYIPHLFSFIWDRILESATASDSVLRCEKEINDSLHPDLKYAFEERRGKMVKQYSIAYATLYESRLNHMIERRMRQSIFAEASCWYTAWVNAGQPPLDHLGRDSLTLSEQKEYENLNLEWKKGKVLGRDCGVFITTDGSN